MAKCVILHHGALNSQEHFPFLEGKCHGCGQSTSQRITRSLGYRNAFWEVAVPECPACDHMNAQRQTILCSDEGWGILLWAVATVASVIIGFIMLPHWWQALLLGVAGFLVAGFILVPLFVILMYLIRQGKWLRDHPDWPITLLIVDFLEVDVVGDVAKNIMYAGDTAKGQLCAALVFSNNAYAEELGKVHNFRVVSLAKPPTPFSSLFLGLSKRFFR